ncbi:MAG: iron ABC transporter permease [Oscillospiraceae bacterium]|nr:iron ABC transporter permease [Oscillospiraceae bacterium]
MKRSRYIIAAAVCLLAAVASLSMGQVVIWPWDIQGVDTVLCRIFLYARLPRTLACLFSGAALAVSGAVMQSVLGNKLASPGIIGVNAGAGLGVSLCCAFGLLSGWAVSASAFLGSLIAAAIITLIAYGSGASKVTVILSGVALNSILNAASEAVCVLEPDVSVMNVDFRVGGFSAVSYGRLVPASALIAGALLALFLFRNELEVLTLGDDTAGGLGLRVKAYRFFFLGLAAVAAGAAVSVAGLLGFVGLIVPHAARKMFGGEIGHLLPASAILGAILVTVCDLLARLLFMPYELPVGVLLSAIGGPVFIILLLRRKGARSHV